MGQTPENNEERTEKFLRLLSQHETSLRGYILAMVLNRSDADDIAQEARLLLWKEFGKYDRSKDFGAWARTIAHFLILTNRKKSQRRRKQLSEQFLAVMGREFEIAQSQDNARREALDACLEKMSDYQRALITACHAPHATVKDVATRMGRSVRGMQQTVARLRVLLQRCVEGVLEKERFDG